MWWWKSSDDISCMNIMWCIKQPCLIIYGWQYFTCTYICIYICILQTEFTFMSSTWKRTSVLIFISSYYLFYPVYICLSSITDFDGCLSLHHLDNQLRFVYIFGADTGEYFVKMIFLFQLYKICMKCALCIAHNLVCFAYFVNVWFVTK